MRASDAVRDNVPRIPLGRCYLVIGPNTWGRAFTAKQAWENAEKPTAFMLFDAPPDAMVDDMGGIVWTPALYYEPEEAAVWTHADEPEPRAATFSPIGYTAKELFRFMKGKRIEPPKG